MSHEIETMAFANALPWHGLGQRVDDCVSVDDMLVAAGLDWQVNLHPMFAYANGQAIPVDRQALIRDKDNKVLTVTGNNWKPLQNKDALDFFREYTERGGAKLETAGSLRGGKVVWGLANLGTGFTINGTDHTKGYLLLISPHEVGNSIQVQTTQIRVVCANTLAMATRDATGVYHRQHHMKEFDASLAKEAIGLARYQIEQAHMDAETLSSLKMSEFDSVRYLARFFQTVEDAEILEDDDYINSLLTDTNNQSKKLMSVMDSYHNAPGAVPGNAWGVLSAVTHWADHKAGRETDARMFNAWIGDVSRLKLKVRDGLLEMAQ